MRGTVAPQTVAGLGQTVFPSSHACPACKLSASHSFVASASSSLEQEKQAINLLIMCI